MTKVLLIEDDPLLVDIYTAKLQEDNFEVKVVQEGKKVWAAIESEKPDLILLDIVLPQQDGWDILRELKDSKDFANIPVVILSNLGQKEEVEKGLSLGAAKYLIKAHYTPSQVVEELKNVGGVV